MIASNIKTGFETRSLDQTQLVNSILLQVTDQTLSKVQIIRNAFTQNDTNQILKLNKILDSFLEQIKSKDFEKIFSLISKYKFEHDNYNYENKTSELLSNINFKTEVSKIDILFSENDFSLDDFSNNDLNHLVDIFSYLNKYKSSKNDKTVKVETAIGYLKDLKNINDSYSFENRELGEFIYSYLVNEYKANYLNFDEINK
ncbi:MAG: hypothetical protein PHS49_06800 [Candidatus Gracilibacteria bacterium]|nr:hypothetical protein [Candidatus Gracilibacteria bacterium]